MAEDSQTSNRIKLSYILIAAAFLVSVTGVAAYGKEISITNVKELDVAVKNLKPGDKLILKPGEWRDAQLRFRGTGTDAAPIVLAAAEPGKVILTGTSTLRIGGEHLVVEGLFFKDPDPSVSDLIQFRIDSDELAYNCRMTNCAVIAARNNGELRESRWLGLHGRENRVDHCAFKGKPDKGTTFVVWLGNGSDGQHIIDHNYFGPREPLGDNGGETIRVGDSKTSMLNANCLVEKNLFERCNGEAECVSNKSCGNIYRENTFLEVSGALTLRHGNGCLVEGNIFIGNEARGTGGVRIIGEDHVVRGNFMENLTGDDGRSAISLMMGIPNSPAHRYFQVKRALIENNVMVDCKHSILIGLKNSKDAILPPIETVLRGNSAVSPKHEIIEARCDISGIVWEDNHFSGKALGIDDLPGIDAQVDVSARPDSITRQDVGPDWQRE
jgi:poly(beta-D-mannuronate) lyase